MRTHSLALAVSSSLLVLTAGSCACNNVPYSEDDAGTDAGETGGGTGVGGSGGGTVGGGGGGDTGGGTGGGTMGGGAGGGGAMGGGAGGGAMGGGAGGGAACTSDPGCTVAAAPACDSGGTNRLGTCVDVGGGCLKVQSLTACPSTLQTCASGANTCACPGSACTPGANTSCASATSVVACALDAPGGCGIYPTAGATACGTRQACTGTAPSAACTCVVDAFCSAGVGTYCSGGNTGTIACALDGNGCTFQGLTALCATPTTCSGTAPAASCTCPAIAAMPVTGGGCSTVGARACETGNTNMVLTCTAMGNCNSWQQTTSCTGASLVCGTRSGTAACECGPNTSTTFYADAVNGSAPAAMPFPSGLLSPAQCRLRTLTSALTLANAAVVSGGSANVIATGATSISTVTFANETFPLQLSRNVTLSTTDPVQAPGNYVIAFNNSISGTALVLQDLATLSGFIVQQVTGSATSRAISVLCPNTPLGPARITGARVVASPSGPGTSLAFGVVISGACPADLTQVDMRSATQSGLWVNATAIVNVNGGTLEGNRIGATLNAGTTNFTNVVVRNNLAEGILLSPLAGEVLLNQSNGVVEGNARDGLLVNAGTGATMLSRVTINGTEFRNNGNVGPRPGISILARTATLTNVDVHDNVGGGLSLITTAGSPAPTVDASGTSRFDLSSSAFAHGVNVAGAGASFVGSQTNFQGNRGAGVHVGQGGAATLHGGVVANNGAGSANSNGLEIEGAGTLVVDRGTVIQNNVNSGIRTFGTGGIVSLQGSAGLPIDISRNGRASTGTGSGAWFASSTVVATNVIFRENGRHGVQVTSNAGTPINISASIFSTNVLDGLRVESSERTPSFTNTLNVSGSTFSGSQRGINVLSNTGNVWASFQGNVVSNNLDTGLSVTGTTGSNLNFTGNTIINNRFVTLFGGVGAGGVVFQGVNPPGTRFSFQGNVVHHNLGHQVLAVGQPAVITPTWDLRGTSSFSCTPASANLFACYNGVPAPSSFVGIMAISAGVQANGNSWQNPVAPVFGTDFSTASGGFFISSPPSANCAPSTITCP